MLVWMFGFINTVEIREVDRKLLVLSSSSSRNSITSIKATKSQPACHKLKIKRNKNGRKKSRSILINNG